MRRISTVKQEGERYHKTKTPSIKKKKTIKRNNKDTTFFSKRHNITETKTKTNRMTTQEYDRMLETLREVNTLCAKAQGQYHAANGI